MTPFVAHRNDRSCGFCFQLKFLCLACSLFVLLLAQFLRIHFVRRYFQYFGVHSCRLLLRMFDAKPVAWALLTLSMSWLTVVVIIFFIIHCQFTAWLGLDFDERLDMNDGSRKRTFSLERQDELDCFDRFRSDSIDQSGHRTRLAQKTRCK